LALVDPLQFVVVGAFLFLVALIVIGYVIGHAQGYAKGLKESRTNQPMQPTMASPQGKFCPNCGARAATGAGFCSSCGNRL
jgi:ABC-type antimicrobial peptide transport system permease subunit